MEEITPEKKIARIEQVYAVGGSFTEPSDFVQAVNRNLQILQTSDKYCHIKDIKFNIFNDNRYANAVPIYLAFIRADVDVDVTPEPEIKKKKSRRRKKNKK